MNREDALMIFFDMQAGALGTVRSMDQGELRANAISMAQVVGLLRLPVLMAMAEIPGPAGVPLPDLMRALPRAVVVKHTTNDCWKTPGFVSAVQESGRPDLIMAGLATDVGLCLTATSAVRTGHGVYAVVDVSGTLNDRIEQAAWLRMMQAGVRLTSWTALTAEIQGDYTLEPGPQLRAIIGESLAADKGPFTSPAA